MPKAKSFPSLGARIAAAIVSYQLGHAGVDRLLKQYADVKLDPWWEKVGRELQEKMVKIKISLPDTPTRIQ
jgi:hypothetical protein